jgi:hypothetical protein
LYVGGRLRPGAGAYGGLRLGSGAGRGSQPSRNAGARCAFGCCLGVGRGRYGLFDWNKDV